MAYLERSGGKAAAWCGVDEATIKDDCMADGQTSIPTGGFTDGRMTLRNILRTWQAGSGRRKWVRLRSYWKRLRAKISIKY